MSNQEENDDKKPPLNNYMRYSGLGFQIAGSIVLGFLLGHYLDKWVGTKQPYFTLGCSMLFLAGGMYLGFRDLLKKK